MCGSCHSNANSSWDSFSTRTVKKASLRSRTENQYSPRIVSRVYGLGTPGCRSYFYCLYSLKKLIFSQMWFLDPKIGGIIWRLSGFGEYHIKKRFKNGLYPMSNFLFKGITLSLPLRQFVLGKHLLPCQVSYLPT